METKEKREYTGMKTEKIEFNSNDIIATSGGHCASFGVFRVDSTCNLS